MIELIRALQTIKDVCAAQKNCHNCPMSNDVNWCLIMDGEDGICPRDWPVDEIIKREIDKPCQECGGNNIRFDLTATENGFAIEAYCRDCAQKYVIKHREAIRKMWNEGYFEEADDE